MIVEDHGTGGLLSKRLLDDVIVPKLKPVYLGKMEDSGIAPVLGNTLAMTTDSFVIDPIFFGNGDIGKLAICGTVNDLAVSGATPKYLTLAFILEEGFLISELSRILDSICKEAQEANVYILAGDTKVVGKGDVDKIYINTAGVGFFAPDQAPLSLSKINKDDHLIITGHVGNHGIHILSFRDGLGFETKVLSDCAPLNKVIQDVLSEFGEGIHYMRDITRGGVGCILNEIAAEIGFSIYLNESSIPMQQETVMAAEMLGIDPLYLANEGNLAIFCSPDISEKLVALLSQYDYTQNASVCGSVQATETTGTFLVTKEGSTRIINSFEGMQLARLC